MEDIKERVFYLRDVMRFSFRQISKDTGLSRRKVTKIYRGETCIQGRSQISRLDKYYSLIAGWFGEYPNIKAWQVYEWLKEREIKISYGRVAQYTREFRCKKQKVYHTLNFLPGEEGQVDWFFVNQPGIGKLAGFVLILSYSRYVFATLFPRSSFEYFIEGHLKAFEYFKGTPRALRYDNLKSVVQKRRPEVEYNPRYLEFSRYYGTEIRLCNPAAGNEKGRVERVIRSMRETFFNIANQTSLETLNQALYQWVKNKNETIHRSTGQKPIDLFKEEKLKPLPENQWKNVVIYPPTRTTKTGCMIFDTNAYSVPDYMTGKSLSIHSTPFSVKIYYEDKEVASHPRCFERNKQIINPVHRSFSRISHKAKMERILEVIKNMHPVMDTFLTQNQTCGDDPQKTAYEIFKLLKKESRRIIVGIAEECLKRKSPRLKTFFSYLNLEPEENAETVQVQKVELLNISYQPRSLEEYDNETRKS